MIPPSPCATCPWRIGSSASAIPRFDLDLAEGLDRVCGVPGKDREVGTPMMACHGTGEGEEGPCWGWARQVGVHSLTARVVALRDRKLAAALAAEPSPDLYPDWPAVIARLRETTS